MVWAKVLKLLFAYIKNIGHSVFYNVTLVSTIILFLGEVIDAVFVELPPWAKPYLYYATFGIFVLIVFLYFYGYIRSKWVRKAVLWMNNIEKYKKTPLLDPYWEEHQRRRCGCCGPSDCSDFYLWDDGEQIEERPLREKKNTLAKKLDDLQTKMGLVIGAFEAGELTLKEASLRCEVYVKATWDIVDSVTR